MPRKKFIPRYLALDARLSQLGTEGELVSPLGIDLEKNRASLSYLLFRLRASIIQRSATPEPSSEIRRGIANAYIFLRNSSFGLASPPSSSHSPSTFAGPKIIEHKPILVSVCFISSCIPWEAAFFVSRFACRKLLSIKFTSWEKSALARTRRRLVIIIY